MQFQDDSKIILEHLIPTPDKFLDYNPSEKRYDRDMKNIMTKYNLML